MGRTDTGNERGNTDASVVVDSGQTNPDTGVVDLGTPDSGAADSGAGSDAGGADASSIDCSTLSEGQCVPATGCETVYCAGECGAELYAGCYGPNDPRPGCPAPRPCPCDEFNETECAARSDQCHAVYFDPQDCPCAGLGCCAQFQRCAAPQQAQCMPGIVLCDIPPPHCEGPYVVSYENDCYEGCVLQEVCSF